MLSITFDQVSALGYDGMYALDRELKGWLAQGFRTTRREDFKEMKFIYEAWAPAVGEEVEQDEAVKLPKDFHVVEPNERLPGDLEAQLAKSIAALDAQGITNAIVHPSDVQALTSLTGQLQQLSEAKSPKR